jgi:hypothetical protein
MALNYIYLGTLIFCFFTGTLSFCFLGKESKIIYFLIFITIIIESIGFYNQHISIERKINPLVYQIFSPLEAILIGAYFFSIIEKKYLRNLVVFLTIVDLIIFGFDLFFNDYKSLQNFKLNLLPMGFYVMFCIFFYQQLLQSDLEIRTNPFFWIVTGILFFNTSFFFLTGFINYIRERNLALAKKLFSINHLINIFYYSLITYGFICQRISAKSSS